MTRSIPAVQEPTVLRYSAFTTSTGGGNPAGVVLDAGALDERTMQRIAAEVGYSETAFLAGRPYEEEPLRVRYFSPLAEVDFCGHATIASAVALGDRHGPGLLRLRTNAGDVEVAVTRHEDAVRAELTSVETWSVPASDETVDEALEALRWARADLGDGPAHVAYAGARHLLLPVATRARLADLHYDFGRLKALMEREGWTTVNLFHRTGDVVHARNPFPVGGVVEDPATGAAAAALGGYLLATGAVTGARRLEVHQGDDMGSPSRLVVTVDPPSRRVRVAGTALPLT